MLLPTKIDKYPGHIWRTETGYRIGFQDTENGRETRRFPTYKEAFEYLQWRSECEDYKRVKNLIYREKDHLRMALPNETSMLFDEADLELAHGHIWHCNNKGYAQCSQKKGVTSTLFHVCMMGGRAPEGHEYVHRNNDVRDNRRCNVIIVKKGLKRKRDFRDTFY